MYVNENIVIFFGVAIVGISIVIFFFGKICLLENEEEGGDRCFKDI